MFATSLGRCLGIGKYVALAAVIAACQGPGANSPPPVETSQYAGPTSDPNTFAALATDGTNVLVYICDGTPAGIKVDDWLKGTVLGGSYKATATNGAIVTGRIDGSFASGTVSMPTLVNLSFNVPIAHSPAGLYRHEETTQASRQVSGWIVLANGDVRGGVFYPSTTTYASYTSLNYSSYNFSFGGVPPPPPPAGH
jgi:hypothetical protein